MRTKELEAAMQYTEMLCLAHKLNNRSLDGADKAGDVVAIILAAEVRRLEADKRRLDWLESLQQWPAYHDGLWHNPRTLEQFETLRAAIDKELEASK